MSLKRASSLLLAVALMLVSALGSACDARCALGAVGHHHDGAQQAMHHCAGQTRAENAGMHHRAGTESRVHAACALDHVWAAREQAPAHFDISGSYDIATATLRDARADDGTDAIMWLRPPIHRASRIARTTLPLRI